jgi:hypothetical protein
VNGLVEQLTGIWGARIAAAGAAAGAIGGGAFYLSLSGILWGLIAVLGVFGALTVVSDIVGRFKGDPIPAPSVPLAAAAGQSGPVMVEEATESEAELLSQGRFDEYHLAKARRYLAAGDAKQAAYHAGASLAHGDLPEAHQVRKTALAAA